ncbi:reverse transcriptase domain-containing protein [Tanacetum coccineum]|uniref:RNA-directed DNA polymerase n=1 Tax=Tanacetum coccineum TaxID=301880 RepID=A0ABQ4X192_9ASTR
MMALTRLEEDDWSMEIDAEPVHFGQDGLGDFDWSNKADDTQSHHSLDGFKSEDPTVQMFGVNIKGGTRLSSKKEDNRGGQSYGKANVLLFLSAQQDWRLRGVFVSTDWRHPWDPTLRTLPKSRMTKQGNFTQRTPQAKKQSDQASRQVSKQASGSTNTPYDVVFPATGPSLGTTQPTATITSTEDLQRAAFTTPPQTAPEANTTEPPPPPIRNKGPELGADNLTLEGVATELAPSDFVSQNYETLVALMQEEAKKRSSQSLQARLNFGPEDEVSPPRRQKERHRKDNRRPPVFGRIGKQVSGTQTANLQNLDTHESNDRRISVRDRLGSRDVHSRLGQRRSPSESPPSSDSEDSRRKRRRRVSSSSEDTSDNEDAETGHWKSKNKYRGDEDEDMSRPWRRRSTIENWPQPVWCHMFNSTLVGNARNWFSKLPRRSIDGFEELRRAFRLNFTQRKKCAKNPVELARVKQRQGESTSAYVERYKDECIHVKACPEILKISGFMNGINNPELIKRLNDRVPQTFDELMKRTRSFIQGEAAAADSRKGYSNNRSQEQSRRQSNDQSSSRNNSYRGQRGGRGNDKYTPLTMTPKEILATEGSNFPKPPPMRTPEEQRVGNGYCEYHRQKGHTTNECVQLRQLIDKLVKEGRLDHLVKNIKEGKDKQRSGGKKDAPRDKADTIYMVQSWQRKTKQKVSQKFSHGSSISFPTLTADNAVVEPLTIEINAAGHDIHRMYIDGGASADILYEHCFQRLRPEVKSQLNPATTSLTGFTGEKIWPMGQLRLPVMVGNKEHSTTAWMNFMVIRSPSPYNGIIGRPGISAIRAVPSTAHDSETARTQSDKLNEHKLKIRQGYSPVRQKKRGQAPERAKAILEEVHKLVEAGIMREVYYHDWLSNPVMVKKSDGSWRMCVDFTDLNKACPQDCYPLPEIDWKVESLCGYPFKCFLDAYKGYHQIQMAKDDEEKTAFHTSQGVYCYTKMPFSLKNAGATYQRLVDNAFEGQVGRNLEVYVDDLVIKSHTEDELVRDIVETFRALRKINMKLNPKKCTFGLQKHVPRVPIQVSRQVTPLVQNTQEVYEEGRLPLDYRSRRSFHAALAAYSSTSHANRDSVQTPVYFVSRALKETEINYSAMEKLILALVFAAKRLRRYFQAHPVAVITDQPIKQVISKPDASGRLQKWSVLLGEHNISYRPRTAVKGQILADFLIEKPETNIVVLSLYI